MPNDNEAKNAEDLSNAAEMSRRKVAKKIAGGIVAVTAAISLPHKRSSAATDLPQVCQVPSTATYYPATEAGWVSDSLGTRYVEVGEFIYPEVSGSDVSQADPGATTDSTPAQCGVYRQLGPASIVQLGSNWTQLTGRYCPWQESGAGTSFGPNQDIYVSGITYSGTHICHGGWNDSRGSSVWYCTAGSGQWWFWSGGTNYPVWNWDC